MQQSQDISKMSEERKRLELKLAVVTERHKTAQQEVCVCMCYNTFCCLLPRVTSLVNYMLRKYNEACHLLYCNPCSPQMTTKYASLLLKVM